VTFADLTNLSSNDIISTLSQTKVFSVENFPTLEIKLKYLDSLTLYGWLQPVSELDIYYTEGVGLFSPRILFLPSSNIAATILA
jgi:hypothetical protein